MNVITVENISKIFRRTGGRKLIRDHVLDLFRGNDTTHDFYALKDLSFQVAAQESVAIIGANGAGKSTLLSMVVGLAKPDKGKVEVNGRVAALLELGSGFHPDLTGTENVFLNAALLGFNEKQTKELIGSIVEFAELRDVMNEALRTYSTGMMMRLAFSIAVHVDPAILIVDEVLGVGDVAFQEKCFQKIQSLRKEGRTLLCVSHSSAIVQTCERAIWLDHGEMVMDGPVTEVVGAYTDYMAAPHNGLPSRTVREVPKVRVMRPGGKARAKGRGN
jgi:ABC-type polysaccharide/polyol phosphate transport system ATPase subunit